MEISIGLFVGIIILGILAAIYNWVRLGMPFGKLKTSKRQTSRQTSKKSDSSNADELSNTYEINKKHRLELCHYSGHNRFFPSIVAKIRGKSGNQFLAVSPQEALTLEFNGHGYMSSTVRILVSSLVGDNSFLQNGGMTSLRG